jgi:hypothetical protein
MMVESNMTAVKNSQKHTISGCWQMKALRYFINEVLEVVSMK